MKAVIVLIALVFCAAPALAAEFEERVDYQVTVSESGGVHVRKATRVLKDGVEIGKHYTRHVLTEHSNLSDEPDKVKRVALSAWSKDLDGKLVEAQREVQTATEQKEDIATDIALLKRYKATIESEIVGLKAAKTALEQRVAELDEQVIEAAPIETPAE